MTRTTLVVALTLTAALFVADASAQRRHAAPRVAACPFGQERNADTHGQCCYPAQVWSEATSACVGTPRCEPSYEVSGSTCACPAGRGVSAQTSQHCCWPGQLWSSTESICVGPPTSCPATHLATADACTEMPSCDGGRVATARSGGHCCWPGQTWSGFCAGAPSSCPSSSIALADTCAALPACDGGRLASAATQAHCCWPGQAWDAASSACTGAPAACPPARVASGTDCVQDVATSFAAVRAIVQGLTYHYGEPGYVVDGHYGIDASGCRLIVEDTQRGVLTLAPDDSGGDEVTIRNVDMATITRVAPSSVMSVGDSLCAEASGAGYCFFISRDPAQRLAAALVDLARACGANPTVVP